MRQVPSRGIPASGLLPPYRRRLRASTRGDGVRWRGRGGGHAAPAAAGWLGGLAPSKATLLHAIAAKKCTHETYQRQGYSNDLGEGQIRQALRTTIFTIFTPSSHPLERPPHHAIATKNASTRLPLDRLRPEQRRPERRLRRSGGLLGYRGRRLGSNHFGSFRPFHLVLSPTLLHTRRQKRFQGRGLAVEAQAHDRVHNVASGHNPA